MTSSESITQTGSWIAEWRNFYPSDGTWAPMDQYKYEYNTESQYMNLAYMTGNCYIGARYQGQNNTTAPKVLQARFAPGETTDIRLKFPITETGNYNLTSINMNEIKAVYAYNFGIDVRIMKNSQIIWQTSNKLDTTGESVAFPDLAISATTGDNIYIELISSFWRPDGTGNGVGDVYIEFCPVMTPLTQTEYDATQQIFNQISTAAPAGNMSSPASITQTGPWIAEWRNFYPTDGSWTPMDQYKYEFDTQNQYMNLAYMASNSYIGARYQGQNNTTAPKVLQARFAPGETTDLRLKFTIPSAGIYSLTAGDMSEIKAASASGFGVDIAIKKNDQVLWQTSNKLDTSGESVNFPNIQINAVTGDIVYIELISSFWRPGGTGDGIGDVYIEFTPVLTSIPVTSYGATQQVYNEISTKTPAGNMSAPATIAQSGPWISEWRDFYPTDGAWSPMTSYQYEFDTQNQYMNLAYKKSNSHIGVRYQGQNNTTATKVLQARFAVWDSYDLRLKYTVQKTGLHLLTSEDFKEIKAISASGFGVDVKIYKNEQLLWQTSNRLDVTGETVNFPDLQFSATSGDNIYIEMLSSYWRPNGTGNGAGDVYIELKPVIRYIIATEVTGITNGAKAGKSTIAFNLGRATLNGNKFLSGTEVKATGDYTLNVGNIQDNTKTLNFRILIYGDVNGDGAIDVSDLANTKLHILNSTLLQNAYFEAGDISKNGKISISDLLAIKKQILEISTIPQL
jgi:uncharacterized membrane protein